jgi:hypothetical protein
MARSIIKSTTKRKRGRPSNPEGRALSIPISFSRPMVAVLDAHAAKAGITRSEAVRQLIEAGLKAKSAKKGK